MLRELFLQEGIELTEEQSRRFARYAELLVEHNARFNLTTITDPAEIEVKHFLDSAAGARLLELGARVADVGSGAGFPAIPLKIIRNDLTFTLIDSLKKRVVFLDTVVKELRLDGVVCLHMRAEDAGRSLRESFDAAVARAVAPMATLAEYALPLVKKGGVFVAYKGSDGENEARESARALALLGGKIARVESFRLPDGSGRSLIAVEKAAPTPPKYPRGQNKPRSCPLG